MTTAVVVGSGPNGLAAALTLADAGVDVTVLEAAPTIGGGTRSVEATLPGLLHDECSGFHPLALDNRFSRAFDLGAHGLEWAWAPVEYAHPIDGGSGGAVVRSVGTTADSLGADARAYRRVFGPLAQRFGAISEEFLQPMLHVPRHPVALGLFGATAALPASWVARRFRTEEGRALWAGVAAHAFRPLGSLMSSAIGGALGTAAHHAGWPVAVGGSQSIADSMAAALSKRGGRVEVGRHVRDVAEIAEYDVRLLDLSPGAAADLLQGHQRRLVSRAYRRFKPGPGAYQVALAVEGGIPWTYEPARSAGTIHVGGSFADIAQAEREVWAGRMPERPFVLLGQQYLADPSRSQGDLHPVDAYAHVPYGYEGDATEAILGQIERFAPGFRDRVVAMTRRTPADIGADNPNMLGGDIVAGANTVRQLVLRPRLTLDPYDAGMPGTYLCSAATPPGAGAHGMAGHLAASSALRDLARG
ncbi:MAG: NAD(P)/FAD-dependent oxidoreductase [Aeromicrobium erythreum]